MPLNAKMQKLQTTAVILAAGMGTRMKSQIPKAMHPLAGMPMIRHLINKAEAVFDRIVVVVGPDMEALVASVAPHPVVIQRERLGTGHAALQAAPHFGDGDVAILYADNPLISVALMRRLIDARKAETLLTLMAMRPAQAGRYGRVVSDKNRVLRVVEWKDASEAERLIPLCNAGVLCCAASKMHQWLTSLRNDNAQGEYYLTDIVAKAASEGTVAFIEGPETELAGINTRAELSIAEHHVQQQLRAAAMDAGATLVAPETVFFSSDTQVAPDCLIEPHVVFGPGVRLARNVLIRAFSHVEGCEIGEGARIGPYARIRPGTKCAADTHVGNFVELKATQLGEGSKVNHLSYIGDTNVGDMTNIGAGTITCNYDGAFKHKTKIGSRAFIGSNSILVAPIRIGSDTLVAAGSTLTEDVPDAALAVARTRQVTKPERGAAMQRFLREKKERS